MRKLMRIKSKTEFIHVMYIVNLASAEWTLKSEMHRTLIFRNIYELCTREVVSDLNIFNVFEQEEESDELDLVNEDTLNV